MDHIHVLAYFGTIHIIMLYFSRAHLWKWIKIYTYLHILAHIKIYIMLYFSRAHLWKYITYTFLSLSLSLLLKHWLVSSAVAGHITANISRAFQKEKIRELLWKYVNLLDGPNQSPTMKSFNTTFGWNLRPPVKFIKAPLGDIWKNTWKKEKTLRFRFVFR